MVNGGDGRGEPLRLMAEASACREKQAEQEQEEREEKRTEDGVFPRRSRDQAPGGRQQMPAAPLGVQERHAAFCAGIPQKVREHSERQGKRRPPPEPQERRQAQPGPEQRDPGERVQGAAVAEFARQNAGGP